MGSSTAPIIIIAVAGALSVALLAASFTGHMRWARSRTRFMGRVSKWVRIPDPGGDEWQLISHRSGFIAPVGAPSLLPGPIRLLGEFPNPMLYGWLFHLAIHRGGWTVAVGPYGSRVGTVVSRRCRDRESADYLLGSLTEMIRDGTWNPDWRPMPE